MDKLELKHWLAYAPYKPMVYGASDLFTLNSAVPYEYDIELFLNHPIYKRVTGSSLEYSLVLHPLSDLIEEIEINGKKFIPAIELAKLKIKLGLCYDAAPSIDFNYKIVNKPFGKTLKVTKFDQWVIMLSFKQVYRSGYWLVQKLFEWHFDVFGLIENNLAIDINTLEL